jgi:cation transport ATPase
MTVAIGGALALQEVTDAAAVVVLFFLADWLESSCTSSARNAIAAVLALKPELAVVASSGKDFVPLQIL